MISSEKEYFAAMRNMIRKVRSGYVPAHDADHEELEVLAECIRQGYLLGKTTYIDEHGREQELRTLDGKMHPEITNHVIPPKGLAFLSPNKTERKSNIALGVSICAVVISLFAFIVTLLSNLDKIIENWDLLMTLFS